MEFTKEELNPCTIELKITVEQEKVTEGYEKAIRELSKNVRVSGFRPGSAPRNMVLPLLNPYHLQERAADIIMNKAYREALQQSGLEPFDEPTAKVESFDPTKEFEFSVKVPLPPIVELGDYNSIPVEKPIADVTDEHVDNEIERIRKESGKYVIVEDRGAQTGDIAIVEFVPLEDGYGEGKSMVCNIGSTFGALDQLLTEMQAGETKIATLTYPSDFHQAEWADKMIETSITLKRLNAVSLPELNDEFAIQLGLKSLDELKENTKQQITSYVEGQSNNVVEEKLLAETVARSTIHIPDSMWEKRSEYEYENLLKNLEKSGKTLEGYATENQTTPEAIQENIQQEIKSQVVRLLVIKEIAKKESIEVSHDELAQELVVMAYRNRITPEEMSRRVKKDNRYDELFLRALYQKVVTFIKEKAVITEVPVQQTAQE